MSKDYREIQLTKGMTAIVDVEDYEELMKNRWTYHGGYACRRYVFPDKTNRIIAMHRILLGIPIGVKIDHINGNSLDNRKSNLRMCTHAENMRNRRINDKGTSKYKGVRMVHRNKDRPRPWEARLGFNGKYIYLGVFKTEEEAAQAYNDGAVQYFGEYAKLNIIE